MSFDYETKWNAKNVEFICFGDLVRAYNQRINDGYSNLSFS
ncbi:hypothetical protein PMAL9190_01844 [Photobacterium malacitanum]|uniref:Uncharacterized protein n=1 Tax=Photobacterium malacitanum TaxID=2204294 RepID=A0A1Y6ME01_9GAMM|nr:hypothetical protein PMAL9190_01844 [Photobacterium malacitanum]